jgi:hypothetical protein
LDVWFENHSASSGPSAMSFGPDPSIGVSHSVAVPPVVSRPIRESNASPGFVYQSAPSGPTVSPSADTPPGRSNAST